MNKASTQVYSVSELTGLVKDLLEGSYPALTVEGEISNCRPASSGHYYFNLKDRDSMIQAVMFRGRARSLGFEPADGMLVRANGSLSVYSARGQYQILVEGMVRAGIGDILALLEERKRRLALEGLFDEDRKRPLPRFPTRIAVITSPSGAAIRDILNVLARRNAGIGVVVLPAAVQGEAAAGELRRQLETANRYKLADVIIIGRGGGSIEDLLAFSDEALVRAIAASDLPVISAVGHEVDWALSDYAADLRAPTPSAAAELVSESRATLRAMVTQFGSELETALHSRLNGLRIMLGRFEPSAIEGRFMRLFHPALRRFDEAKDLLIGDFQARVKDARHRLELAEGQLTAASPSALLERGYALVRTRRDGALVKNADVLKRGDLIDIQFAEGSAAATIEEAKP